MPGAAVENSRRVIKTGEMKGPMMAGERLFVPSLRLIWESSCLHHCHESRDAIVLVADDMRADIACRQDSRR